MKTSILGRTAKLFLVVLWVCSSSCQSRQAEYVKPNILFIPVDDLRPDLGCYGSTTLLSPHIDRLAADGVTFTRAYCQQSVCNPSRASLLTGLRPDSIQVWDLRTSFREVVPEVVTLPQYFKQQGYTTIGLGKTFHNNIPDTLSWTRKPHIEGYPFDPDAVYLNEENLQIQEAKIERMKARGQNRIDQLGHWYVKANAIEIADAGDDAYFDGAQTSLAIEILNDLVQDDKPFFLSVGYFRPHLPFNAPQKYWDLYDRASLPLADNTFPPEGSPDFAVHGDQELRSYDDCHDLPWPGEAPWDEARQRELVHGYHASVSYIDAQVGRLLDALKRKGLYEETVVVVTTDHGFSDGQHGYWGKHNMWEDSLHVPLIIRAPGLVPPLSASRRLTEHVDLFPTLCDLCGLPQPDYLEGSSLVPLFSDPRRSWKEAVFSWRRPMYHDLHKDYHEARGMRTERYRFTSYEDEEGNVLHTELFDHLTDPYETRNLALDLANHQLVSTVRRQLDRGWRQHPVPAPV